MLPKISNIELFGGFTHKHTKTFVDRAPPAENLAQFPDRILTIIRKRKRKDEKRA